MSRRRRRARLGCALLALVAGAASVAGCGGGPDRLDAAAFCEEFAAIGPSAQGSADAIASGLEALAPRAPTPELGEAVAVVADVFAAYGRVEREGGDAGMEIATLAEDPAVAEAAVTFEAFLTNDCGLSLGSPDGVPGAGVPPPGDTPTTGDRGSAG